MDAKAHLLSLGWAGPGHALDSRPAHPPPPPPPPSFSRRLSSTATPTSTSLDNASFKQKGHRGLAYDPNLDPLKVGNTGQGLVKPLLISQRKNRFGIGKKSHEAPQGNEWWLKGFESALGNIGKSESERSASASASAGASGLSTPTVSVMPVQGIKHGGLYSFFVAGQVLHGTIGEEEEKKRKKEKKKGRKRTSDEFEEDDGCLRENRLLNLRSTSLKKPATAEEFAMVGEYMRERDRGERKKEGTAQQRKKGTTKDAVEQFAQIGEFFGVVEGEDRKKRKKKQKGEEEERTKKSKKRKSEVLMVEVEDEEERENKEIESIEAKTKKKEKKEKKQKKQKDVDNDDATTESKDTETKEERRERKRWRKEEKAARLVAGVNGITTNGNFAHPPSNGERIVNGNESEDSATRRARRAERKKRKGEREKQ